MSIPHTPSPVQPASNGADRVRGRLMQASLTRLLDRARGAREALPLLAALERALPERGASVVDTVSLSKLPRLCSQLSSLPLPDDDLPLQDLMNRLLQALQRRQAPLPDLPNPAEPADDNDMTRTVVIQEVSHSEYMAVAAAQQADTPTPR